MLKANQIQSLRGKAADIDETRRLQSYLQSRQLPSRPIELGLEEMEQVLRWKLRLQYGRGAGIRSANTDGVYRQVTRATFSLDTADRELTLTLRTSMLVVLPGIGVPVASAILALLLPGTYGVIDFRVWNQLYGATKHSFSVADYLTYMRDIWRLSDELGWSPQEVDLAVWERDRRASERARRRPRSK